MIFFSEQGINSFYFLFTYVLQFIINLSYNFFARYWIERDNYYQALQYMNLLKGGAKILADDWMSETREYLATKQAAHTLLAYASASLQSHVKASKIST